MASKAIIIEAGQHSRSLDTRSSQPKTLDVEKYTNKQVLDWIMSSLKSNDIKDITYIGNYHIEKVIKRFPDLHYIYYSTEDAKNEIEALNLYKNEHHQNLYIIRSDIVLLPSALTLDDPKHVCIYHTCTEKEHDTLALIYIPANINQIFFNTINEKKFVSLDDINVSQNLNIPIVHKWIDKKAASISKPHLLSQVIFQGKGKTLENIAPLIKKSIVLDQIRFTYGDWLSNETNILCSIQNTYPNSKVIVRSNTRSEDDINASHAGAFLSLLDISTQNINELKKAIIDVFSSYNKHNRSCLSNDEILVQKQVQNIKSSGVLLTKEPGTGSPYYVLSIDSKSGRSDTVTAGCSKEHIENYYIAWSSNLDHFDTDVRRLIDVARELLSCSPIDALDIEFCIDHNDVIYLLQLRPLIINHILNFNTDEIINNLNELSENIKTKFLFNPSLSGKTTVFGIMPDWNPAEIIGVNPNPLALSLYQTLVGNQAYAEARALLGYRKSIEPLIHSFSGAPYVDVRASANSLLPNMLNDSIATQWIDWCIEKLKSDPFLHDKVEFEIYITCLSPNWESHKKRLMLALQNPQAVDDMYHALHSLTQTMVSNFEEIISIQTSKLNSFLQNINRYAGLTVSPPETCRIIRILIQETIHNGIIPFSILARMAFISITFLRDYVDAGIISESSKNAFLHSIPSIASKINSDLFSFQENNCTLDYLIQEYGHLRPHSYDITSENYAANPKRYFQQNLNHKEVTNDFNLNNSLQPYAEAIKLNLSKLSLDISYEKLIKFMTDSISLREHAKFQFMKGVNQILIQIENFGKAVGISVEKMAFMHIDDILRFETDTLSTPQIHHLTKSISFNQKKHILLKNCRLPELITRPEDVLCFKVGFWKPNFITLDSIIGEIVYLENNSNQVNNLKNKIICIEAADPGYDWIFGHDIAGLITAYGGIASHMAIRAAEFNIPAAIGCGITQFNNLKLSKKLELNCHAKIITVIE